MSYTIFQYANLRISPAEATTQGDIIVTFDLTNTGRREGDEIPQLYIHQYVSSTINWEQALRGFDRIHLEPGETRTVSFTVPPATLAIWNAEMKRVVEPGKYEAQVGASSSRDSWRAGLERVPRGYHFLSRSLRQGRTPNSSPGALCSPHHPISCCAHADLRQPVF